MSAAPKSLFRALDQADVIGQFEDALRARGIIPPQRVVTDGKLHRCNVEGRGGKGDAAYVLHSDGIPAGGFQNWRDGLGWEDWRTDVGRPLTADERDELRQKAALARVEREAEEARRHAEAAARSDAIWREIPPCTEHPYLDRKGVRPHGVRLSRGKIVVPVRDTAGKLHSLQFIGQDGSKKFLSGGRIKGGYFAMGRPDGVILIGEGFATCASAHEATGYPVAVAFDCGNLRAVAEALRAKYPNACIVLLADDDYCTIGNPGIAKAKEAANAINGAIAIPEFGPDRPDGFKDFNDMVKFAGGAAVKEVVEAALTAKAEPSINGAEEIGWADPDMAVLRLHRRRPPRIPLAVFGPDWANWIEGAAEAAACPPDYVVAPLLAIASALIGHSRWVQATPGWSEPPHLWPAVVGDSGTGKSPGADCLWRDVLPEIERNMLADFPDRLQEWRAGAELARVAEEQWKQEVRSAHKASKPPPDPPPAPGPEPQAPRLRQNDVTIERVATLLASAAPKGLLIVRDELAGWIAGMCSYNDAGRAFWVESFGGRPYRVERQKNPEPIIVPRLAVAVYGGVQPERLGPLMRDADDGLLARILWAWPDPIAFRLSRRAPGADWAIDALDRLRWLDLQPGNPPQPIIVPLSHDALPLLEAFARGVQERQEAAGGLMRSALGKARGLALRLSLVLETLWWCGASGMAAGPTQISPKAFAAAAHILDDYYLPMAERVYGDASATQRDRNAATLARWILRDKPPEMHVRALQRDIRLPGLAGAEAIHAAAGALVDADWLRAPLKGVGHRGKAAYPINPRVWEATP